MQTGLAFDRRRRFRRNKCAVLERVWFLPPRFADYESTKLLPRYACTSTPTCFLCSTGLVLQQRDVKFTWEQHLYPKGVLHERKVGYKICKEFIRDLLYVTRLTNLYEQAPG